MLPLRLLKTFAAVGFVTLMFGCGGRPASPASPTPPPLLPATPPTSSPLATSALAGMVFEVTATGRVPLAGAAVELMTCGTRNCPDALDRKVTTDKDGAYRLADVYDGDLNFLWVRNQTYQLATPMTPGTCPDNCDLVITINGETRRDIELSRR